MRKTRQVVLSLVLLGLATGMSSSAYRILGRDVPVLDDRDPAALVKELASIPEHQLDLGIASLRLAKEIWPDLDVNAYTEKIDKMVEDVRILTKNASDPDQRIRAMNTYLYKLVGIDYDREDPLVKKPENKYLNGLLDRKKGSCITMPLLYAVIAQRLGWPVKGVRAPRHTFIRYEDLSLVERNIEATGAGGYESDENYRAHLKILDQGIKSGLYLKSMSNKEWLAELINMHAGLWISKIQENRGKPFTQLSYVNKTMQNLRVAEQLSPISDDILVNIGNAYNRTEYFERKSGIRSVYSPVGDHRLDRQLAFFAQSTKIDNIAMAQAYYRKATMLGANPNDYTDEWQRHYIAEVESNKEKTEARQKQFEMERPALIEALHRSLAQRSLQ